MQLRPGGRGPVGWDTRPDGTLKTIMRQGADARVGVAYVRPNREDGADDGQQQR
jgi:hypothetical protein